jgi:hypothetical protein
MTVNSEFGRELEETIGALCKVPPRDLNREFTYIHTRAHAYTWVGTKVPGKILIFKYDYVRCTAHCACWYMHEHSALLSDGFDLMWKKKTGPLYRFK